MKLSRVEAKDPSISSKQNAQEVPHGSVRALIRLVDLLPRRVQGIVEFSDQTDCLLRIRKIQLRSSVALPNGTRLHRGEAVIDLHFWNEHLPANRSVIRCGVALHTQLQNSFTLLAETISGQPQFSDVAALHGRIAFLKENSRRCKYVRLAQRYGFLIDVPKLSPWECFHNSSEKLWLRALLWTFNPPLQRSPAISPMRLHFWMPRSDLLKRYSPTWKKQDTL